MSRTEKHAEKHTKAKGCTGKRGQAQGSTGKHCEIPRSAKPTSKQGSADRAKRKQLLRKAKNTNQNTCRVPDLIRYVGGWSWVVLGWSWVVCGFRPAGGPGRSGGGLGWAGGGLGWAGGGPGRSGGGLGWVAATTEK